MVISLIKPKLLLALIGPVEHPPAMNGAIGANDTVISNGASPGSSNASSSSSSTSVPVAQQQQQQQQHRVPRESPLRILQLKSEGMTEFLQEQLRGFRMPEEA